MQLRPAGKYLLFEQQRHLIGSSTKLKPFQPALSSASCPAHEALSISFSWGYRCTECVLNAILNLNPSCKYCKDLAATLNVGAYHYMGAAEELARMGGNCIALRAAAVALIILLKAVDPVLLRRYLKWDVLMWWLENGEALNAKGFQQIQIEVQFTLWILYMQCLPCHSRCINQMCCMLSICCTTDGFPGVQTPTTSLWWIHG